MHAASAGVVDHRAEDGCMGQALDIASVARSDARESSRQEVGNAERADQRDAVALEEVIAVCALERPVPAIDTLVEQGVDARRWVERQVAPEMAGGDSAFPEE